MRKFQAGDSQSVLNTLEEIIELFARDEYEKAFELFGEHKYFKYSPKQFKDTIEEYFDDKQRKKVTSAYLAGDPPAYKLTDDWEDDEFIEVGHPKFPYSVTWDKDGDECKGNYAHAELPINGSWSDMTIKFYFDQVGDICWLVLEDVEVM